MNQDFDGRYPTVNPHVTLPGWLRRNRALHSSSGRIKEAAIPGSSGGPRSTSTHPTGSTGSTHPTDFRNLIGRKRHVARNTFPTDQ